MVAQPAGDPVVGAVPGVADGGALGAREVAGEGSAHAPARHGVEQVVDRAEVGELETGAQRQVDVGVRFVDRVFENCFGETRPCELNASVARAAALADQTPDPQLAALIAVAVLARCPYYIRHANFRGLSDDGAVLVGPWGGVLTVPPELRRFLATYHQQRRPLALDRAAPLFPGETPGRLRPATIQRRLAQLDAPASLWQDPPDTTIGDGANAEGSRPAAPPVRVASLARRDHSLRSVRLCHFTCASRANAPALDRCSHSPRTTKQIDDNLAVEGTRRALAIADEVFPATFKVDIPDAVRITIALLARCVTTTQACVHLAELGRRSDLMVCVRTLYEHTVTLARLLGGRRRRASHAAVGAVLRRADPPPRRRHRPNGRRAKHPGRHARGNGEGRVAPGRREDARAGRSPSWRTASGLNVSDSIPPTATRRRYVAFVRSSSGWAARSRTRPSPDCSSLPSDALTASRIGVEPAGRAHEAMLPVPVLIGTALTVSAQALGKPSIQQMNVYFEWLTDAGAK